MPLFNVKRELEVSLSELVTPEGDSIGCVLGEVHRNILSVGQQMCMLRQSNAAVSNEELEAIECTCWATLTKLEELTSAR